MHLFILCQFHRYILDVSFIGSFFRAMEDVEIYLSVQIYLVWLLLSILYVAGNFTSVQNRENLKKAWSSSIRCVIVRMHLWNFCLLSVTHFCHPEDPKWVLNKYVHFVRSHCQVIFYKGNVTLQGLGFPYSPSPVKVFFPAYLTSLIRFPCVSI